MRRALPVMLLGSAFMAPRDLWEWTLIAFGAVMAVLSLLLLAWAPHPATCQGCRNFGGPCG